jgi:hypothetical protein
VLQQAEKLGNVTEACAQAGISRPVFYKWRERYRLHGVEGLQDRPPLAKSHPHGIDSTTAARIVRLSLERPELGCARLALLLKDRGISVSGPTVQSVLTKHGLGKKAQRLHRLASDAAKQTRGLTEEQERKIAVLDPFFRERADRPDRPGEQLVQAAIPIGKRTGHSRLYLHVVIDCFNAYAFGLVSKRNSPPAATDLLAHEVLPFYDRLGLQVATVVTSTTTPYWGTARHAFRKLLAGRRIRHVASEAHEDHGFLVGFKQIVTCELLPKLHPARPDARSVAGVEEAVAAWLGYYNYDRPGCGYPNFGGYPAAALFPFYASRHPPTTPR